jgi:uncharacterized protein (DUF58 family)
MPETKYLDPAVIGRLATLELKARTVVEGFLSGLHRSPFKGFSVEFAEYRQYMPGDALSTIDWRVFARTDRYYVKKFEEETNLDCHILLDTSASMRYAGAGRLSKFAYGAYLAASLAYLMHRQRDAVGFMAFDDEIVQMLPASARPGHLRTLLVTLERLEAGRRSNVSKPLHHLAEMLSRRGMVVLISDLFDDPASVIAGLKHLRFRGTDVLVFHVLDPDELTFPFDRPARFADLESDDEVMAVPSVVRDGYLAELRAVLELYQQELRVTGIDYQQVETSTPLEFALLSYLSARQRRI